MGKDRKSKRQLIRDEKKAKKRARDIAQTETSREKKRQRRDPDDAGDTDVFFHDVDGTQHSEPRGPSQPNREFFGMLADDEQEHFRSADQTLEENAFESDEDRDYFLQSLYLAAEGKELKLASSQSCSRLMEKLILLSNTRQKKALFEAFAGHFVSLLTHRFASHCCERLFIQSAPIISRELGGMEEEVATEAVEGKEASKATMEELFLLTLDELEEHLSYLLSDRFGSHALRVLLVVLSGRPLDPVSTKTMLQSKRKEHITVQGQSTDAAEANAQVRVVPQSFTLAVQKILEDTVASMDSTALRVLATHPTGNPVLQLMIELDMSLNGKDREKKDQLLILRLLPGAPESLSDNATPASEFVNSMMYDPVGSRLLETIITHAPAKIFKALNTNFFGPRIQTYVRNDVACYPAIKALHRMSKDDLQEAVTNITPEVSKVVAAKRLNVLKALFDRCQVRHATTKIDALLEAMCAAYGCEDGVNLIPKLCGLETETESEKDKKFQPSLPSDKQKAAAISHGSQLASTLVSIPGAPAQAIQKSLLALTADQLVHLACSTTPTMLILTAALAAPAHTPHFHKALVAKLTPQVLALARSQMGHNVVNAIIGIPSSTVGPPAPAGGVLPFHAKETLMATLARDERALRETWTGRSVWRAWKGDAWRFRRADWVRFAKEVDPAVRSEDKVWNRVAEKEKKQRAGQIQKGWT